MTVESANAEEAIRKARAEILKEPALRDALEKLTAIELRLILIYAVFQGIALGIENSAKIFSGAIRSVGAGDRR